MQDQTVQFFQTDREVHYQPLLGVYTFRKDKKGHWLQKLCFSILKKLDAVYMQPYSKYIKTVTIDTTDFMNQIYKQKSEVFKSFNMLPTRLIIGAEDFSELMNIDVDRNLEFGSRYVYEKDGKREIQGLSVEIIPWMKGIVVLP